MFVDSDLLTPKTTNSDLFDAPQAYQRSVTN